MRDTIRSVIIGAFSSATAICLLAATAKAGEPARVWTPVAWGGEAGDMQYYFVDRSSMVRAGDRVEVETLAIREVPTEGGVERVYERSLVACGERSSVTLDMRMLSRDDRELHRVAGDGKVETYPEGSAWRVVVDTVCDGSFPSAATTTPRAHAEAFFNY